MLHLIMLAYNMIIEEIIYVIKKLHVAVEI
jgi:hypothetical protein